MHPLGSYLSGKVTIYTEDKFYALTDPNRNYFGQDPPYSTKYEWSISAKLIDYPTLDFNYNPVDKPVLVIRDHCYAMTIDGPPQQLPRDTNITVMENKVYKWKEYKGNSYLQWEAYTKNPVNYYAKDWTTFVRKSQ